VSIEYWCDWHLTSRTHPPVATGRSHPFVINLCVDKRQVFAEVMRVLRPGGRLQFADIANGKEVPAGALRNIDLWTDWIAGGLPCAGWRQMLEQSGFVDIQIGPAVDTFGGAGGESKARLFEVFGYAFLAHKSK
jgi:arsenite methyltransferase